jgi:DNA-binding PadR family transcriptional regulator
VAKVRIRKPRFLVLASLAAGPQHGFGIIQEAGGLTDGRIRLRAGALYAILDRLVADGFVAVVRAEVTDGRVRRFYALTDAGSAALDADAHLIRGGARPAWSRPSALEVEL